MKENTYTIVLTNDGGDVYNRAVKSNSFRFDSMLDSEVAESFRFPYRIEI